MLGDYLQPSIIFDISLVIIFATLFAYLARLVKQPLIPAYIVAGMVIGPLGLGLINDQGLIRALSEIGIAFLLFIVGLEVNFKKLKSVSSVSIFGGLVQVVATFVLGFAVALALGFNQITSIYAGLVVAFSSTMIVIKLLSDKDKLDTLHGRIVIGILIIQDLLVILAISVLMTLENLSLFVLFGTVYKGFLLLATALLASRFLLPTMFRFAAKSKELLFLSAVTTCFVFTIFAYILDFSIIIGAFIAGIALASLPYNLDIIGKVTSLKDFFATIFFVSLGLQLVYISGGMLLPLAILFLVVVLAKPLVVMTLASLFGYEKRTSFLTALSLGQVSEFSLVMVTVGVFSFGHVTQEFFSVVVLLTIASIVFTSYMLKHDAWLYSRLSSMLRVFEYLRIDKKEISYVNEKELKKHVILLGCHRMGDIFLNTLKNLGNLVVVDYNPGVIESLIKKKVSCIYGDVANEEIMGRVNFAGSKLCISTIPNESDNRYLMAFAREINPKIKIVVTANHISQAFDLYESGADYVILPHLLGAKKIVHLLEDTIEKNKSFGAIKRQHLKELARLNAK